MSENKDTVRPFGLRDKVGYMFGDFGNDFSFLFASSFLIVFYTKVLGIPSALVGVLFLSARFVDAITDITMGRIVDISKTQKDGRFRPWIRRMCGPVAIASFLMYQSSMAGASMTVKIIYMFVTYLLWGSIFYTSINIPYGSMASAISDRPSDRAALSTFRSVGASLAGLIIGVGVPLILYSKDASGASVVVPARFTAVAGVFSILSVVCYILCYKMTTERVKIEPNPDKPQITIGQTFSAMTRNRALLSIIVAAIMLLLSQLVTQSMNNYLFLDYFGDTSALALLSLISAGSLLVLAPFAVKITTKFGKKETGAFATLAAAVTYFVLFLIKIENPYAYITISTITYLGSGFFNLIIWAIITDIIDYQEVKTNTREDGTVYAVYSFARKLGQALAGGVGGFALSAIGYQETAVVQTEAVKVGIYNVATLIPGLAFLAVALVLQFWYPLSRKMVESNNEELKRRHKIS